MELGNVLPCSQQLATGPYAKRANSSRPLTQYCFEIHFNIIRICTPVCQAVPSLQILRLKFRMQLSSPLCCYLARLPATDWFISLRICFEHNKTVKLLVM
jgi:hypothetical protein